LVLSAKAFAVFSDKFVHDIMYGDGAKFGTQLGDSIRGRRIQVGITQARLARSAGVSRRHLAALEKGANISVNVLVRVAQALLIPLPDLFRQTPHFPFESDTPLYRSAFISYGGPDETIARRIFEDLTNAGVQCFFFPCTATPGMRVHRTMTDAIRSYDRVILLCSSSSLNRPGVSHEIEQILVREAEEGGTALMIPVALDGALFSHASEVPRHIVTQIQQRVIADFRDALVDAAIWYAQLQRILAALKYANSDR
jgi:transcriptional regulator with XRE-family HTH domain